MERLKNITQFNSERGQETLHPLIGVLDQSKSVQIPSQVYLSDLYIVFIKNVKCEELKYGRSQYDYQEDTLIFIAPGQVFGFDLGDGALIQPNGWVLCFHPDFIHGTSLGKTIRDYGFFSYSTNEALHVSKRERQIVIECLTKIQEELSRGIDKHSKMLIVSNIELLLNYCIRFYDRQFIIREPLNKDILTRFDILLDEYIKHGKAQNLGFPSVTYCASELNLSANYFGDLIKKETGISAQEYIQTKLIDAAKERIHDSAKSLSEISFELGFKYPQHFTRLFKQKVGISPIEYRLSEN